MVHLVKLNLVQCTARKRAMQNGRHIIDLVVVKRAGPPSAGHATGQAGLVMPWFDSPEYLDSAHNRIVRARLSERDRNLTGRVRRCGELLGDRLVSAA